MNWPTLLSALLGTIAGGLISIGALLLKWRLDRHKEAADWFYSRYIEGGLDSLIQFLNDWYTMAAMPSHSPAESLGNPLFNQVPSAAICLVNDITHDQGLFHWFQAISVAVRRARTTNDTSLAVAITAEIVTQLLQLKQLRMYLVGLSVRAKRDAHRIDDHDEIRSFVKTQRDLHERLVSGPMRQFTREYRPKSKERKEADQPRAEAHPEDEPA